MNSVALCEIFPSMSPESETVQQKALRHGRSSIDQNSEQIDLRALLMGPLRNAFRPLSSEDLEQHRSELGKLIERTAELCDGWHLVAGPEKGRHLIEALDPYSEELRVYAERNLKADARDFLKEFKRWIEETATSALSSSESLVLKPDLSVRACSRLLHTGFAKMFTAALAVHRLCEITEFQGPLRERTAYVLEIYRYQDLVARTDAGTLVESFREKQSEWQALSIPDRRPFQDQLYDPEKGGMAKILDDQSGLLSGLATAPKTSRLISYIKKRLSGEEEPPAIVVLADVEKYARSIASALEGEDSLSEKGGALLLSNTERGRRKKVFESLMRGDIDYIVASELKILPDFSPDRPIVIASLCQHGIPLTAYPFVLSLLEKGAGLNLVTFVALGSSDEYRRKRYRKSKAKGPIESFIQESELTLSGDSELFKMHPAVGCFLGLFQKIEAMQRVLERRGYLENSEVEKFKAESSVLRTKTSSAFAPRSGTGVFSSTLTRFYINRLDSAAMKLVSVYPDSPDDPVRRFATEYAILCISAGGIDLREKKDIFATSFRRAVGDFVLRGRAERSLELEGMTSLSDILPDQRLQGLLERSTGIK